MIARIPARWVLARRVLAGIARSRLIGPWRILATGILATRISLTGWILLTSWIPGGRILTGLIGPWLIRPRILATVLRGKRVSGIGPLTCRIPTMGILTRGILTGGILTGLIRILIPPAKIMASGIARSLLLPVDCIWT
ncbi:hypothetical protein [Bifidobacterium sp. A11]|uniref:hypothetical protein n=1 Tax=Bifidobacterium sp. A11 TaxID=1394176 RepID=UPI0004669DE8|nr:hypothetical protein [Bifidobacterium sp. A11]